MKKNHIKIAKLSLLATVILLLVISGIYYYQNESAKNSYFQKYDECDAKAKENPIRSAGGVKNIDELKFVVSCFENKGCYEPCANASEPRHPGINFTDILKPNTSNSNVCEKRCYYSPEYFK